MTKKNAHPFSHKRMKAAFCTAMCSVLTATPAFATGEDNSAATTGTADKIRPQMNADER